VFVLVGQRGARGGGVEGSNCVGAGGNDDLWRQRFMCEAKLEARLPAEKMICDGSESYAWLRWRHGCWPKQNGLGE